MECGTICQALDQKLQKEAQDCRGSEIGEGLK
jgi:hypothetical protein